MNCTKVQDQILNYIDNNLPDDYYLELSEHINNCVDCQEQVKIWNEVLKDIKNTTNYDDFKNTNSSVQDNVMNYVYSYETHKNTFRKNINAWNRLAAVAAAFAIMFAGYAGYSHEALVKNQTDQVMNIEQQYEKKADVVRISSNEVMQTNQVQPIKVIAPYSLGGIFMGIGALSLYMRKKLEKQMRNI